MELKRSVSDLSSCRFCKNFKLSLSVPVSLSVRWVVIAVRVVRVVRVVMVVRGVGMVVVGWLGLFGRSVGR